MLQFDLVLGFGLGFSAVPAAASALAAWWLIGKRIGPHEGRENKILWYGGATGLIFPVVHLLFLTTLSVLSYHIRTEPLPPNWAATLLYNMALRYPLYLPLSLLSGLIFALLDIQIFRPLLERKRA